MRSRDWFPNPLATPPFKHLLQAAKMILGAICLHSVTFLSKAVGFICAGMPLMLCGHFFLKLAKLPEYQNATMTSSLSVGALGGFFVTIPMLIVLWIITNLQKISLPKRQQKSLEDATNESQSTVAMKEPTLPFSLGVGITQVLLSIASTVGLGAGTGYFGSAVLRATGHDTLGPLEATRAGAVGTAILGPGAVVVVVVLLLCCGGMAGISVLCVKIFGGKNGDDEKPETEKAPETKV